MILYKKLNLCSSPIKDNVIGELMEKKENYNNENDRLKKHLYKHLYANDEIEKYLSPVLMDQLEKINLKPAILINFSEYGYTYETWLHRDLTYINNAWIPLEIGLNWELAPSETTFNWYTQNVENPNQSPSPEENDFSMLWPRSMINGIRYYDESQMTQIGSVMFDVNTAYLVRTDLPHKIISRTPGNFRECISVRFFYEDIPTWERALELFEPYFA